jgi:mannose-6-phosphate isomerase-like protein (cupin superfamily)
MQRSPARWAPPRPGVCYKGAVLVRRLAEAPTEEWHRLRNHILMDAGELGSRNISVTWLEVPTGIDQELHSHEEAEQVYVVVSGRGTMTVAGDTQEIAQGDLVMVPPATDHSIANEAPAELCCVSVQSPPVTASEVFGRTVAAAASEYDDEE